MGTYIKSILRSIRSSISRFAAIFIIVALGVGFMAGLLSTPDDMRHSVGAYFNGSHFMDLRVMSNLGMCAEDVAALGELEGVADVMPARTADYVVTTDGQDSLVARFHDMDFSLQREGYNIPGVAGVGAINQGVLVDGRWPENPTECVIEQESAYNGAFALGASITVTQDNKDVEDELGVLTYTIVGHVASSAYLSMIQRGYTTVGNGKLSVIVYVDPACFLMDYYTDVYVTLENSAAFDAFSAEYDAYVETVADRIEVLGETQKYVRRDAILEDAQEQLEDAKKTLADAQAEADAELADALEQLLEGEQELTDGQRELLDGQRELADGRRDYEDGVAELAQARIDYESEISDARAELAEAEEKLLEGELDLAGAEAELADGWQQLEDGQRELEEYVLLFTDGEAQVQEARREFNNGLRELSQAKEELDVAKEELDDGRIKLEEGRAELEDAKVQLDEGFASMRAGERELSQGWAQIQEAEAELAAGEEQLALAKQGLAGARQALEVAYSNREALQAILDGLESPTDEEIVAAMEQYLADYRAAYEQALSNPDPTSADQMLIAAYEQMEAALANSEALLAQWREIEGQLTDVEGMIAAAEELLAEYEIQVAENEALLEAGWAELEAGKNALYLGARQLEKGQEQLIEGRIAYEEGLKELEEAEAEWRDGLAQWEDGYAQWEQGYAELEENRPALEEAEAELEENRRKLSDAYNEIAESRQKLEDGQAELEEGRLELADGWQELADGRAALEEAMIEAELEFADAEEQLADALIEIQDAERKLADGRAELADGELELVEGWEEYEKAVAEVEEKLQEARDEITEAEDQLKDIESPKWYILDRNTNPGYVSYDSDSEKIAAIARVFPVFFLLVATLVASTTMTRMVEEERSVIGTMKALGYGNGAIASKFIAYAGFAAILGSGAGLFIGLKLFPGIIYDAYKMMYNLPPMTPSNHLANSVLSAGAIFVGIMAATLGALKSSLGESAASLMQPKAPKAGKRIFLERITPLWKRMKFTHKVTARNLIRYKKRFFMTVVGIFGCTALLLTGFGLRDAISDIIDIQYGELFGYNLSVGLKHDGDDVSDRRIRQVLEDGTAVYAYLAVNEETSLVYLGDESVEVTTIVPKDAGALTEYIVFRDRVSGESIPFGTGAVLLSEKAAKALGAAPGDVIEVENSDGELALFTLTGIVENYVQGYLYIAPQLFEPAYTAEMEYTTLLVKAADETAQIRDEISTRLLNSPNVSAVQYTTELRNTFSDMLTTIDFIVIVIILCAAILAFVVMYNLTNINITERQKELATIKVLGFYQGEVNMYIYRETIILTVIGAAVGLIGGIFLLRFVVTTAEVDNMMFGRVIRPMSYVISFVITMCFSLIVNVIMSFKMKNISMADSLKAPE